MSWDFGVGDFLELLEKANNLRKRFINAPTQFQAITADVKHLSNVLRDIDDYDPDINLDFAKKGSLNCLSRDCQNLLEELNGYLNKYQDLAPEHKSTGVKKLTTRAWKRVRWDQQEIDVFRSRISTSISALNIVIAGLNSQVAVETRDLVQNTREEVGRLVRHQDQQKIQKILEWLSSINIATKQADFFNDCQKGTGQWFIQTKIFQNWVYQSSTTSQRERSLFCPGIPGAGKTLLASTVINELSSNFENDHTVGVAFFYCNFREKTTLEEILGCLVKQLARQLPIFPEPVEDLYDTYQALKTKASVNDLIEILETTIFRFQRVFIVIDALDECHMADGSRDMLLDQLFALQNNHMLGILATSRENPDISCQFAGCPSLMIRANESDIERFLRGQMSVLPNFVRNKPDLQQEIVDKITTAVDGMYVIFENPKFEFTPSNMSSRFLLARLHLDSLKGKISPKQLRNALTNLSTRLDAAYSEAINRIEAQTPDQSRAAKEVLAWIICATRPLTPIELQHALAIESDESYLDEDNIPDINDLVSICAGLVTIDEQSTVIRLAHYTTQEYFEENLDSLFPGAHSLLGASCIIYLSFEDFESGSVSLEADIRDRWTSHPLYSYCALNMGYHVQKGNVPLDWILQFLDDKSKVSACAQVIFLEREPNMLTQWVEINGFHLAVYLGLHDAARVLIEDDYSVDSTDSMLRTAISWLAEAGSDEGVKFMLTQGADPDHMDANGQTALSYAALTGRENVFHVLKGSGCQMELKNSQGQTPLFYAIWGGHRRIVELLLEEKVDPNCKDANGQTPLLHAVQHVFENHPTGSSRMRIVDILLRNGVDPSCQDKTGQSPLFYAVQGGNTDLVQLLLEAGSSVECEDLQGRTALLCAVALGLEQIVKILLAWGANTECKDHHGKTPLSSSAALGHDSMVQILLYDGADLNSKDEHFEKTALSYAAWNGFKSVVDLLLEYGADPNCTDNQGRTPLSWAAEYGHVEIVRRLLHHSAEPALNEDLYRRTPIAWAALRGHQAVVDLLLATDPYADDVEVKDLLPRMDPERFEILEGLPKSFKIEE
ncbi:hypothetical protein N7540_004884 [Penicillium herquei]|nr:hypothetical protein N7540_004884 [Penicillium herquei]